MGLNKPVDFTTAKLLKEKWFDENCSDYYTSTGGLNSDGWGDIIYSYGFGSGEPDRMLCFNYSDFNKNQKETSFLCPTIAEVVMWLYEKHGIWISVSVENNEEDIISFYYTILKNMEGEICFKVRKSNFNSPTEAYEAAIKYTLKNLI